MPKFDLENFIMENLSYHIRIKKEYASAIIEDLQQVDAIEIIEDQIPDWQQKESQIRLAQMKINPSSVLSEKDFLTALNINDKRI